VKLLSKPGQQTVFIVSKSGLLSGGGKIRRHLAEGIPASSSNCQTTRLSLPPKNFKGIFPSKNRYKADFYRF